MSQIITRTDIVKSTKDLLEKTFPGCFFYADEVKENFKKPCFFIGIISTSRPQTKEFTEKEVTIYVTYYPKDSNRKQSHYMDVFEKIFTAVGRGIHVNDRFLHVNAVSDDTAGEDNDILRVSINITYLEAIDRSSEETTTDTLDEVAMETKIKEL